MNSFVTVLLDREDIKKKKKRYGIMIGIPLLLYLFFLGLNQIILFLRKRNNIAYRILENNSKQQRNSQQNSVKPNQKQKRIKQQ